MSANDWLITEDQFQQFVLMAKASESGNLVLENWKIFLSGGGVYDDFYQWWMKYRPDKQEIEKQETVMGAGISSASKNGIGEKKKSPFDAVKKTIGMGDIR